MVVIVFLIILFLICIFFISLYFIGKSKGYLVNWNSTVINYLAILNKFVCKKYHRLQDTITLPDSGGGILVANHQSGIDPLLLCAAVNRPLRFIIAIEFYRLPILHFIFKLAGLIPVDRKKGRGEVVKQAIKIIESGEFVALYPFGGFHLADCPEPKIKTGVVVMASQTDCPIYSVYLSGIKGIGTVFRGLFPRCHAKATLKSIKYCNRETDPNKILEEIRQELSNKLNHPGL